MDGVIISRWGGSDDGPPQGWVAKMLNKKAGWCSYTGLLIQGGQMGKAARSRFKAGRGSPPIMAMLN
jgi:hypothetical protein